MSKLRLTVLAAIIVRDQKIFCARKAPGKSLAGLWEFPGGKLESGETHQECLLRELREELSVQCSVRHYFATNVHEYDDKIIELVAYLVDMEEGEIHLTDHDQVCWLPAEKLSTLNWAPADVPFIELLQSSLAL